MSWPSASATAANSGTRTNARTDTIISLRMRLSSLVFGAVEDDVLCAPVSCRRGETLARVGPKRNPQREPLCEGVHLDPIHPSAWKGYSRKFVCTILHSPVPNGPEWAVSTA